MFIYKIENLLNGDCYVGKTSISVQRRWKRHLYLSKSKDTHLYRAMRKYGIENFRLSILEDLAENINEREQAWITILSPAYNMTKGGDGGDTSGSVNYRNAIKKRDQSGKKNGMWNKRGKSNPNYTSKRTEQQKENIRTGTKRRWQSNEQRRLQHSERIRGFENNPGARKSAKVVTFEGITYRSVTEAVRQTGRSDKFIRKNGIFK